MYKIGLEQSGVFPRSASPSGASTSEVSPSGALPRDGGAQPAPLNICILTCDIVGPIRNGGIGTAYTYLAYFLKRCGHDVTILYTLGSRSENGPIEQWIDFYAQKGITFVPLQSAMDDRLSDSPFQHHIRQDYGAYLWLAQHHFDVVHASEWRGLAYYSLLAKKLGLAFRDTTFVIKCSSPTLWGNKGGHQLPKDVQDLGLAEFERKSVEWADYVISGSAHLLDWMIEHGYKLPPESYVQKNIMPLNEEFRRREQPGTVKQVKEIVFFGRLEPRKGIEFFCKALDYFRQSDIKPDKVTFMGKRVPSYQLDALFERHKGKWDFPIEVIDGMSQPEAVTYLQAEGRLAVMPSVLENSSFCIYECLAYAIPFASASTGGSAELVAEDDVDRVMFPLLPYRIFETLRGAVRDGMPLARASFDLEENERTWEMWHAGLCEAIRQGLPPAAPALGAGKPRVSVCIPTYNRPELLRRAITSVRNQTYDNVEIIVVDDGSPDPHAQVELDLIEEELAPLGGRIIRQSNQYLGAARNTAALHATGDYLLFFDDDNVALPHEIETFVSCALHSDADILTCFGYRLPSGRSVEPPFDDLVVIPYIGGGLAAGLFVNTFGDANSLIKRSTFESLGGFTTGYGVTQEDQELFAKALLRGFSVYTVPEPLYLYAWSDDSMMRTANKEACNLRVAQSYVGEFPREIEQIFYLAQGMRSELLELRREVNQMRFSMKQLGDVLGRAHKLADNMKPKALQGARR